ncbi:MAG TPA: hypothetical protein VFG07_05820 [Thermoplasmata archaeon]|nr:hypothetical protein [Thermoplasmata archaeon]
MALRQVGVVNLPANRTEDGLDHADVLWRTHTAYIAHTSNDALDVVDLSRFEYLRSIPAFKGVAGALVSQEREMVFTSNRGEETVSYFPLSQEESRRTVAVGGRPNGLAFDPQRGILLAASIGKLGGAPGLTVSLVDVARDRLAADIPVAGRTRWAMFDPVSDRFYVNIREPAQIAQLDPAAPNDRVEAIPIPATGPHGLGLDPQAGRLFCACDEGRLILVDLRRGEVKDAAALSGPPDVVYFNSQRRHLYVAIGDPGVIDVFDTDSMTKIETVSTEPGAGTLAFDPTANLVCAVLQDSHRLLCFSDD